jgi:hypothetical protein
VCAFPRHYWRTPNPYPTIVWTVLSPYKAADCFLPLWTLGSTPSVVDALIEHFMSGKGDMEGCASTKMGMPCCPVQHHWGSRRRSRSWWGWWRDRESLHLVGGAFLNDESLRVGVERSISGNSFQSRGASTWSLRAIQSVVVKRSYSVTVNSEAKSYIVELYHLLRFGKNP